MSDPDNVRRLALECLRMAAECTQLASDIRDPALKSYFIRMADGWTTEAERHSGTDRRPPD